jgi:hypothetical protein
VDISWKIIEMIWSGQNIQFPAILYDDWEETSIAGTIVISNYYYERLLE